MERDRGEQDDESRRTREKAARHADRDQRAARNRRRCMVIVMVLMPVRMGATLMPVMERTKTKPKV